MQSGGLGKQRRTINHSVNVNPSKAANGRLFRRELLTLPPVQSADFSLSRVLICSPGLRGSAPASVFAVDNVGANSLDAQISPATAVPDSSLRNPEMIYTGNKGGDAKTVQFIGCPALLAAGKRPPKLIDKVKKTIKPPGVNEVTASDPGSKAGFRSSSVPFLLLWKVLVVTTATVQPVSRGGRRRPVTQVKHLTGYLGGEVGT